MESFNFFLYRCKHLTGVGNRNLLKLMAYYQSGGWVQTNVTEVGQQLMFNHRQQEALNNSWSHFEERLPQHFRRYQQQNMVTFLDPAYPAYLKEIYNPPAVLFYQGNLNLLSQPSLAVVGSRAASNYGLSVTGKLVPDLVKAGLTIVSGLARGIDTSAHQQAIRHRGQTIGVLGTGLDHVYPAENQRLQTFMREHHLLVSEFLPGTGPKPYHFPARNRIIAGLSLGTLIIEAKVRSGSLITAQLALESGREVFAVPGNILEPYSTGALDLIQSGAKCVKNSQDILTELVNFPRIKS